MLRDLIENKRIEGRAIVGFYPASQVNDDDVQLYDADEQMTPICKFHMLR